MGKTMTVLVTGVSSGFGEALVRLLVTKGYNVVGVARRKDKLATLKNELGERFVPLLMNVSDIGSIKEALSSLPASHRLINVLINNAGLALGVEPAHQASLEDWTQMVDTNIRGLIALTHAILPEMVERNEGYIINIGSTAGNWPYAGGNVYGATKAFVKQFSLNLRADLLGTQIRVSNLEPGNVAGTEFSAIRYYGDETRAQKVYEGFENMTAVDIANIMLWLIESPKHINVNTLEVMPVAQSFAGLKIAKNN